MDFDKIAVARSEKVFDAQRICLLRLGESRDQQGTEPTCGFNVGLNVQCVESVGGPRKVSSEYRKTLIAENVRNLSRLSRVLSFAGNWSIIRTGWLHPTLVRLPYGFQTQC
jgi:hypothetical protein